MPATARTFVRMRINNRGKRWVGHAIWWSCRPPAQPLLMSEPGGRDRLRLAVINAIAQLQCSPTPKIHIVEGDGLQSLAQSHLAAAFLAGMGAVVVDHGAARDLQGAAVVGGQEKAIDASGRHIDEPAELQAIRIRMKGR